jgi:uncharacterized protein with HEPN domain
MIHKNRAITLLIADLVQAATEIVEYTAVARSVFLGDRMRQRAVIQCFEVIGEATKKLPTEFRGQHPALPWRYMAAFRDKLIHDYFEVDVDLVWNTARREIPKLISLLEKLGNPPAEDS